MIPHDFSFSFQVVTKAPIKNYYYYYYFVNESSELEYNKLDWRYIGRMCTLFFFRCCSSTLTKRELCFVKYSVCAYIS